MVLYKACRTSDVDVSVFMGDGQPNESSNTTVWEATLSGVERFHDVEFTVGKERVAHLETSVPLAEPLDPTVAYTAWVRDGNSDVLVTFKPEELGAGGVQTVSDGIVSDSDFGDLYQESCPRKAGD